MHRTVHLFLATLALAQDPAAWTPEFAMQFQTVASVAPSPSGELVAWAQTRAVMEAERSEAVSQIWIATSSGANRMQLTQGDKPSSDPAWSPDGKFVYFLSTRSGKKNLFRIPVAGGEAERLTDVKGGINKFEISPNGKEAAYTSFEPDPDIEKAQKEKRDFRVIDDKPENALVYIVPTQPDSSGKGTARALTRDDRHVIELSWSPDGQRLAIVTWATPLVNDWRKSKLAEVVVLSGELKELAPAEAFGAAPAYSPDGRYIAFAQRSSPVPYPGTSRIALVDRTTGAVRQLLATPNELPSLVGWFPDGRRILVNEALRTKSAMYELPIDGPAKIFFAPEGGVIGAPAINHKFSRVGFTHERSDLAPEAYVLDPVAKTPVMVSAANVDLPKPAIAKTEVVKWKAADGRDIEGLLTYPVNYRAGAKVPFILNIHGGPAGVFSEQFIGRAGIYPIATFAAKGFAVLRPNPRGSSGYGHEFRNANLADWGFKDYTDIMAGVDMLAAKGIVDPDKMAVMGWSYGGYMTSWTITQTARFKAAVIGAPVTNLWSFTGTTDINDFIPDYFGGEFHQVFEKYVKHSPLTYANKVKTPTLFLHGEADARVPITQGYEYYQAIKRQGIPAKMVVYPRMPHGPTEPKFVLDLMHRHLDWVEKYVN